jgi:hypothetical protein
MKTTILLINILALVLLASWGCKKCKFEIWQGGVKIDTTCLPCSDKSLSGKSVYLKWTDEYCED